MNFVSQVYKWVRAHPGYATSAALLGGFVLDNLTLRRVDLFLENLVFAIYLAIIAIGTAYVEYYESRGARSRLAERVRTLVPLIIQFSLGNLMSGFFVFYSRSGSLWHSFPFLGFLALVMIGNEVLKSYYERLVFRVGLLFLALYSFLIFHLPVVLGRMGALIFLLSGLVSVILILIYGQWVTRFSRDVARARRDIWLMVAGVVVIMNTFYFTNILPPIPLALSSGDVYYSVERVGSDYVLEAPPLSWWEKIKIYPPIELKSAQKLFAYSAVFAPTKLSTTIVHHWQRYDESSGEWVSAGRIAFPISGGRDQGYRGYSEKGSLAPGRWRVDVETARGQIIGRIRFRVAAVL